MRYYALGLKSSIMSSSMPSISLTITDREDVI